MLWYSRRPVQFNLYCSDLSRFKIVFDLFYPLSSLWKVYWTFLYFDCPGSISTFNISLHSQQALQQEYIPEILSFPPRNVLVQQISLLQLARHQTGAKLLCIPDYRVVECIWNVMAHAQKPDFVFWRNGWVHLNWRGLQFIRLLAAEVCASVVVILDTPCSEVVWRVLATHSFHQFPPHFPSRASPCAITFQLDSTYTDLVCTGNFLLLLLYLGCATKRRGVPFGCLLHLLV